MTPEEEKAAADKAAADKAESERTYTKGYVDSLKNETIAERKQREAIQAERDELARFKAEREQKDLEAKGEYDKALAKLESEYKSATKRFSEELTARDKRYVMSEAKAAALKAGIIDPADIASVDFGDVKIADDGSIAGLDEKIAALKAAKPHWFKAEQQQGTPSPLRGGASPGTGGTNKTDGNAIDWAKVPAAELESRISELLRV